ncbi:MAG: hypothetical protein ACFFFB_07135 [Candidatus Heimdallarchaeota archaeon]
MELKDQYIKNISKQTGLSRKEIEILVVKKKEELNEISKRNALYMICKELAVDVKSIYDSFQI